MNEVFERVIDCLLHLVRELDPISFFLEILKDALASISDVLGVRDEVSVLGGKPAVLGLQIFDSLRDGVEVFFGNRLSIDFGSKSYIWYAW